MTDDQYQVISDIWQFACLSFFQLRRIRLSFIAILIFLFTLNNLPQTYAHIRCNTNPLNLNPNKIDQVLTNRPLGVIFWTDIKRKFHLIGRSIFTKTQFFSTQITKYRFSLDFNRKCREIVIDKNTIRIPKCKC